jgi:hypothetical protein
MSRRDFVLCPDVSHRVAPAAGTGKEYFPMAQPVSNVVLLTLIILIVLVTLILLPPIMMIVWSLAAVTGVIEWLGLRKGV